MLWRGKSVLRMLEDSAEEGFSCGLHPEGKTAQHVMAKAFKHHCFSGSLIQGQGNRKAMMENVDLVKIQIN